MTASDLKDNLKKLNNSMAFLIKHSQKLFRVITDHTHAEKALRTYYVTGLMDNLWMSDMCVVSVLFRRQYTCGIMPECISVGTRLCRPRLVKGGYVRAPSVLRKHTTKC